MTEQGGLSVERVRAEQLLFRWIWRDARLSFDEFTWLTQELSREVLLEAWADADVVHAAEWAVAEAEWRRLREAAEDAWRVRFDAAIERARARQAERRGEGSS